MRRIFWAGLLVALTVTLAVASELRQRRFAPEQPIDFSHRDHIRGDQLECDLCHSGARRSPFAGIAPIERCMGCHQYVLTPNPEITKLRRAWDAGKTVEWVKVYALPAFVRFNHQAHAVAGLNCDICHGDIGSMNRVERVADLTMGWCVSCHRNRHASIDCLSCHH
jgi:Cytochrome c7 and related cytochrome c